MYTSISATRGGWIKHLALVETMVNLVREIYDCPNNSREFPSMNCEDERAKKIGKKFVELEELIWEATAVSEKVHGEFIKKNADWAIVPDFEDHDPFNKNLEKRFQDFKKAAKDLAALANSIIDATAAEIVEPEVVYPGGVAGPEEPKEDPRQLKLGLQKPEPPTVDPSKLLDYKKQAANDTDKEDPEPEDGE